MNCACHFARAHQAMRAVYCAALRSHALQFRHLTRFLFRLTTESLTSVIVTIPTPPSVFLFPLTWLAVCAPFLNRSLQANLLRYSNDVPCQTLHLITDISLDQAKTTTSSCDKALQIFDPAVVVESVEEILGYLRRVWLWRTSTTSLAVWQRLWWMQRPESATLYALKKLHGEETTYEQSSKPARRALSCWSPTGAEVWCLQRANTAP